MKCLAITSCKFSVKYEVTIAQDCCLPACPWRQQLPLKWCFNKNFRNKFGMSLWSYTIQPIRSDDSALPQECLHCSLLLLTSQNPPVDSLENFLSVTSIVSIKKNRCANNCNVV